MTFEKINENNKCNCIDGCLENYEDKFARLLGKNQSAVDEEVFKSKYEKNKAPKNDECKSICTNRAVSVALYNDNSQSDVINYFKLKFNFSPKYKSFNMIILKFKQNAGKIKQFGQFKYHYDFYKSDEFALNYIEIIENIDLSKDAANR